MILFNRKLAAFLLILCFTRICLGIGSDLFSEGAGKLADSLLKGTDNILQSSVNLKDGITNVGLGTIKYLGLAAQKLCAHGVKLLGSHPEIARAAITGTGLAAVTTGAVIIAAPLALGGYVGYRWVMNYRERKLAMQIAEKAAYIAREESINRMRIAAEAARIANAKSISMMRAAEEAAAIALRRSRIVNGIIITGAALGIGYAGYCLYRSIQYHRCQDAYVKQLLLAKQVLLHDLEEHKHEEVGQYGLPHSCSQSANALLTMQDGRKALDEIVGAWHLKSAQLNT